MDNSEQTSGECKDVAFLGDSKDRLRDFPQDARRFQADEDRRSRHH